MLFSAFLASSGLSKALFLEARHGRFELCLSEIILQETAHALLRKLDRYAYGPDEVIEYVTLLSAVATLADEVPDIPPVCRDPDDDHVLAAALAAGAEAIVTGDDDLLSLRTYEGIRILSVREALEALSG